MHSHATRPQTTRMPGATIAAHERHWSTNFLSSMPWCKRLPRSTIFFACSAETACMCSHLASWLAGLAISVTYLPASAGAVRDARAPSCGGERCVKEAREEVAGRVRSAPVCPPLEGRHALPQPLAVRVLRLGQRLWGCRRP